jgi:hypothetical protein
MRTRLTYLDSPAGTAVASIRWTPNYESTVYCREIVLIQSPRGGTMANLAGVVQLLKKEQRRLTKELQGISAALAAFGSYRKQTGTRGRLSAAARARIAAAQRARWAKVKASKSQSRNGSAAPKRAISAAARKRMALAQRARWAKVRAAKKAA